MTLHVKEVHTPLWIDRISKFDDQLEPDWICDVAAVSAGNEAGPRREAIKLYLRRRQTTVVVAMDRNEIVGYLIGDDDEDGRGGCRGRYMGVGPDRAAEVMQAMFDHLSDVYGWIWGRITNPLVQAELTKFGCQSVPGDPTVFTYRKPTD
jgi:hypothetical protein